MIGVLAELERSLIVERAQARMREARRLGAKFGRKKKLSRAILSNIEFMPAAVSLLTMAGTRPAISVTMAGTRPPYQLPVGVLLIWSITKTFTGILASTIFRPSSLVRELSIEPRMRGSASFVKKGLPA